jgi:hypothetical protein
MTASIRVAATLAALALCALCAAPSALAGTPASVTVRVLGPAPAYEALTAPKQVTTTTTPVTKDGGSCSGTSAAGALELASAGDWEGNWSSKYNDYEVIAIDGHSYPFEENAPANYYWSFWHNNVFAEVGVCEAELQAGDQVLFVPSCYGTGCPPEPTELLGVEVPSTAEVGKPVTATVRAYPTTAGGTPTAAAGVILTGGGAGGETDSGGQLALTFAQAGTFTLRASGAGVEPRPIPGEASICIHSGNDGTCGTTLSHSEPPPIGKALPIVSTITESARILGVKNGQTYTRRSAPRLLEGSVQPPPGAGPREVRLALERIGHGHCSAFNGRRVAFKRAKCGTLHFFKVADTTSFSYLLPAPLRAGRYVYAVEAVNYQGAVTKLANGVSRVAFRVK